MNSRLSASNWLIVSFLAVAAALLVFQSRSQFNRWWVGKRAQVSTEITLLKAQVRQDYYEKREDKHVTKPEYWTAEDESELKRLEDLNNATDF